jgi:hypothetical protein
MVLTYGFFAAVAVGGYATACVRVSRVPAACRTLQRKKGFDHSLVPLNGNASRRRVDSRTPA